MHTPLPQWRACPQPPSPPAPPYCRPLAGDAPTLSVQLDSMDGIHAMTTAELAPTAAAAAVSGLVRPSPACAAAYDALAGAPRGGGGGASNADVHAAPAAT